MSQVLFSRKHNLSTGQTLHISTAFDGSQSDGGGEDPSISGNGRCVAFRSEAKNIIPGGTNLRLHSYFYDIQTGVTTIISVSSEGEQGNGVNSHPIPSADGRYVVFASYADNLVPNDSNDSTDVFVHDRQTGQTIRISVGWDGTEGNDHSNGATISADGRYIAFSSSANNLVSGDTNGYVDIFLFDMNFGGE